MNMYPKRYGSAAISITRFYIEELPQAKNLAKLLRTQGYTTRIVFRGPREKIKSFRTREMITECSTRKKNAVGFDLYVYVKNS